MSIFGGYENQKKIIYLLLFIIVAIPILRPIGLPVVINNYTRDFYRTIEELPAGSVVLVHYGFEAGAWGELESQCMAVSQHLFQRPLKLCFVSTWPMGSPFIELTLRTIDLKGKIYGKDYINVGYIPGWETAVAAMANDFHSIARVDYYGNSIRGTFLDDVNTGANVQLVVAFECGSAGANSFLLQFGMPFGTKIVAGSIGSMVQGEIPYYNSGQIKGILASVRGGGEYELLIGRPGKGVIGTDVLSFAHIWVIIAMILGNIAYFTSRRKVKTETTKEEQK